MEEALKYHGRWEKRWHPLWEQWIVYAAHRNNRPWSGALVKKSHLDHPEYAPNCYLCPGNKRISGLVNPNYTSPFLFDNDHPVLGEHAPAVNHSSHDGLYHRSTASGNAKVLCYDPRHNVTLSEVSPEQVQAVFLTLKQQMASYLADPAIHSVLIFENKGQIVGVSNPHPHCQIYASDFPFKLVEQEMAAVNKYHLKKGKNLFEAIIEAEQKDEIRIIAQNDHAIAFIPFFARYAYEVWIFPKAAYPDLHHMPEKVAKALALVFQEVIQRFDLNYQQSFPYVMSILQAPLDGLAYPDYRMHLLLQPPLRQPGLQKFLAGPEIGAGNFMADTIPEEKAAELRKIKLNP